MDCGWERTENGDKRDSTGIGKMKSFLCDSSSSVNALFFSFYLHTRLLIISKIKVMPEDGHLKNKVPYYHMTMGASATVAPQ